MRNAHLASRFTVRLHALVNVVAIGLIAAACSGCTSTMTNHDARSSQENKRLQAEALWKQKCKNAGVFIRKTASNVDGIYLINVRNTLNFENQYAMDDPYGSDAIGKDYIETFLRGAHGKPKNNAEARSPTSPPHRGFKFVEARDPDDGKLYRYTGKIVEPWETDKKFLKGYLKFVMEKMPIADRSARYGVKFEDISSRADRDVWVAGSSLTVIDLSTDEVVAERRGYMVDLAQGSTARGRSPWLFAANNACPDFDEDFPEPITNPPYKSRRQPFQALRFVEKVLMPSS